MTKCSVCGEPAVVAIIGVVADEDGFLPETPLCRKHYDEKYEPEGTKGKVKEKKP